MQPPWFFLAACGGCAFHRRTTVRLRCLGVQVCYLKYLSGSCWLGLDCYHCSIAIARQPFAIDMPIKRLSQHLYLMPPPQLMPHFGLAIPIRTRVLSLYGRRSADSFSSPTQETEPASLSVKSLCLRVALSVSSLRSDLDSGPTFTGTPYLRHGSISLAHHTQKPDYSSSPQGPRVSLG